MIIPLFCVFYLLFVFQAPKYIKTPVHAIKKIIPIYNLLQIFLNVYLFYIVISDEEFVNKVLNNLCGNKQYSTKYQERFMYFGFLWCIIKLTDFLDTVFFILRKKNSHVTFLHVYHHFTTAMVAYVVYSYLHTEQSIFYASINCCVHSAMYFYYFLTSIGVRPKWKKLITIFQLIQFLLVLIMTIFIVPCQYNSNIKYFYYSLYSICQCVMYIYLFLKFFVKSYR
nr:MAG: fatty acids protein [Diabrotica toursvirus 3a]